MKAEIFIQMLILVLEFCHQKQLQSEQKIKKPKNTKISLN